MGFSERDKLVALAIVHIFETGKPFGDYSIVAVLNDGAGISYGINQFTHRSGSLYAVLHRFVSLGGELTPTLESVIKNFKTGSLIGTVSANATVKRDLRTLGKDPLMQRAQQEIAFEMYLKPAIEACEGSDFTLPLSLAVIYDSINHGSYAKIRDRVVVERPGNGSMKEEEFEREWITQYVKRRDAWLESIPRLKPTAYRTDFFLAQIARDNWHLDMPVTVQGVRLTESMFETEDPLAGLTDDEIELEIPTADEPRQEASADLPVSSSEPAETHAEAQNFMPEMVAVDAPPPTGFIGKIKAHIVSLGIGTGTLAGLKEYLGIQLSAETVELLKVLLPTVLGLGFIGFLVWFVSEKVVGFKTLKMQSEINTDPSRHNVRIRPQ